jgi:acetolactate synthase-1/2/3 large subunit
MGYAVPGAMGARLAYPDRPILAFSGDGGVMMAIADLQTAWRENLPIIVLVFDDQEVGLIRVKQEIKGLPAHGVHIGGVDWEKLGHAFGADAAVADTEEGLAAALGAALKSKRTTIVAARIDPSGYVAQFNALREL